MEGDGADGADRGAGDRTRAGVDAAGDVEGHDRRGMLCDPGDRLRDLRPWDSLRARTEQAVDHELGAREVATSRHPERIRHTQHRRRVATHAIGRSHEHDPGVEPRIMQMTCHDEAVAAVVAGAADDRDATGIREVRAHMRGGRGAGRLHQRDRGQPGILDGAPVEFPQVFGPPQRLHGS